MTSNLTVLRADRPEKRYGEIRYHELFVGRGDKTRGHWVIMCAPHVAIKIKRLFPRVKLQDTGAIAIADTAEVAREIEWVLDRWPMEMEGSVRARLLRQADRHRETETAIESILTGGRRLDGLGWLEPELPPREYQQQAGDILLTTGRLLLLDVLGLGKTFSGMLMWRDQVRALPALVVVPTHLAQQWAKKEIPKFFPMLKAHIIKRGEVYVPAHTREMNGHDPDILVITYSKIAKWVDYLLEANIRSVIFDEIQDLRRRESQKYAASKAIADQAELKAGLTATPVYNYGGEIYNIVDVLAPGVLGTREEFNREWGGGGDKERVREPKALGTYLRDTGVMLRRTKKDVFGQVPPEPERLIHEVDVDEDEIDAKLAGSVGLAEMLVKRNAKPLELMRGGGDFDWRMRHATGIAKAAPVADFVEMLIESGSDDDEQNERQIERFGRAWRPVVLLGWHHGVYDIWAERLKRFAPGFYTGRESDTQKAKSVTRFLQGDTPLLIMSLRSTTGLNGLQDVCNTMVFGELDWSPGFHDQGIGRLDRPGQEFNPVVAYFCMAEYGSDPVVAEVNGSKRMESGAVVDPDAELFGVQEQPDSAERIQRLAADFLRRRQEKLDGSDHTGRPQLDV